MEEDNQAKQVVKRLKEMYRVSSDVELSAVLAIPAQTISTWKQRNSTPFELCIEVAKEKEVDLNWLLMGKGTMYRNALKEESPVYQSKSIGALEELFDRVDTIEQELSEMRKQA